MPPGVFSLLSSTSSRWLSPVVASSRLLPPLIPPSHDGLEILPQQHQGVEDAALWISGWYPQVTELLIMCSRAARGDVIIFMLCNPERRPGTGCETCLPDTEMRWCAALSIIFQMFLVWKSVHPSPSSSFSRRKETPASLEHIWRRSTSCHTLSLFFFFLLFLVHNTFNLLQILSFPFCTHASNSFFSSFVLFPVLIEMPEAVSRLTPTMDAREKSLAATKL